MKNNNHCGSAPNTSNDSVILSESEVRPVASCETKKPRQYENTISIISKSPKNNVKVFSGLCNFWSNQQM